VVPGFSIRLFVSRSSKRPLCLLSLDILRGLSIRIKGGVVVMVCTTHEPPFIVEGSDNLSQFRSVIRAHCIPVNMSGRNL
jgi:hypothetical protein